MINSDTILKLFNSAIKNDLFVSTDDTVFDVLNKCKDNDEISLEYKDVNAGFAKVEFDGKDYMRMVFELKPQIDENGNKITRSKVQNIEKTVQLVKNLEKTLIYLNECYYDKIEDNIYIDARKLISIN